MVGESVIAGPRGAPRKLYGLQALRVIAASLMDRSFGPSSPSEWHDLAFVMGAVGVWVFFLISGFIMAFTTHHEPRGPASTLKFLVRRLLRVVPLYWVFTLLTFGLAILHHKRELSPLWLLKSLLFVPYVGDDGLVHPILHQGWTLNYEMLFYAIFAAGRTPPVKAALSGPEQLGMLRS